MFPSWRKGLRYFMENFGWETWTRTRIARSRVWSPTNWTISQQGRKKTNRSGFPRIGTATILYSNLIGFPRAVNRAPNRVVRQFPIRLTRAYFNWTPALRTTIQLGGQPSLLVVCACRSANQIRV